MMDEQICLYTPPLSQLHSYREMIALAAEYGIRRLEVVNMFEMTSPDAEAAKELRRRADSEGISIPCVSAGLDLTGENHAEVVETLKRYAECAAILGSPFLHHTIALEFQHPERVLSRAKEAYALGVAAAIEVRDCARSFGLKCLYEDQGFLFNGKEAYGRFLADMGPEAGTVADFGNIMFVDETVPSFIDAYSDRIVHVHAKDYRYGTEPGQEYASVSGRTFSCCALGEGDAKVPQALEALHRIGYIGAISLECPPAGPDERAAFEKNLRYMENALARF